MENSKYFSAFITAIIYSFTIVLYTKADIVKQYNFSDTPLNIIAKVANKTSNLVFQKKVSSNF